MTGKPLPEDLQTILREALQAYELARVARWRAEQEAHAARRAREQTLAEEEKAEKKRLEAERTAEEALLRAEQERLASLEAAAESAEAAARILLEKAGLAHIAGAPATVRGQPATLRRSDEEAARAFAEAQTAYIALRTALLDLAQTHLDAAQYEEARRILGPLLEDTRAPLYAEARDLLCESHYRPALDALDKGEWEAARQGFAEVLKVNPAYRDTAKLEREAYLRPARQALEAGRYEEARVPLETWLKGHKDDAEARDLLCESHYRPALAALKAQQWEVARQGFVTVLQIDPNHRYAANLERETYLRPARAALEAGRYEEARAPLEAWLKDHKDDAEARDLLCETFYRPALSAIERQDWGKAAEELQILRRLNPTYRNISEWGERHPTHRWFISPIQTMQVFVHKERVSSVIFSYDGHLLVSGSHNGEAKIWNIRTGSLLHSLTIGKGEVTLASAPYEPLVAIGSYEFQWKDNKTDGIIAIWDISTTNIIKRISVEGKAIHNLVFSDDSLFLVAETPDDLRFWPLWIWKAVPRKHNLTARVEKGSEIIVFEPHKGRHLRLREKGIVRALAISPEGRFLASVTNEAINIWEMASGRLYRVLRDIPIGYRIESLAFSPGSNLLAAEIDGKAVIWNIASGSQLRSLPNDVVILYPNVSPDKKLAARVIDQSDIAIYDLSSNRLLHKLSGHEGQVMSVAFSPDGRLLASGSYDETVKVWEVSSGRLLHTLSGHTGSVNSVAFSPDGRMLASGSYDRTVKIWAPG